MRAVDAETGDVEPAPLTKEDFEALAQFRFGIRRYLRFSEETVRRHGLSPQQYQLLLALKGFPGREWATVRELAERHLTDQTGDEHERQHEQCSVETVDDRAAPPEVEGQQS